MFSGISYPYLSFTLSTLCLFLSQSHTHFTHSHTHIHTHTQAPHTNNILFLSISWDVPFPFDYGYHEASRNVNQIEDIFVLQKIFFSFKLSKLSILPVNNGSSIKKTLNWNSIFNFKFRKITYGSDLKMLRNSCVGYNWTLLKTHWTQGPCEQKSTLMK